MTNIFFISFGFLFIQLAYTFTNILDEKQLVEDLKNDQKLWNDIEIQFSQGDYAGFFSANKTYAILDELAQNFPLLCKFPQIIGYTYEDRTMFVYPLSNIQKEGLKEENAIFLNGLHHAREPLSVSMGLYTYGQKNIFLLKKKQKANRTMH
ncbi:hypothetical protein PPERSA_11978 [Pseudocohnilembus persalinus]|uniref:Peptidase M14 domain-containing protein n=1 Tax=Pseudocohnilembus persalinus TaxID=266149 RepID=A0A0V0QK80_PSEPJ|nr:hypothetical protein PPERSA_11978 [Pseudocohnilembus persalinus]|eukprot:KRX02638.1 hypothetical protein PPERSA_11978 [Pseudocohnilembus persalinus]